MKIKNQSCKWEFFPYLNKKKVSFDSTQKFIDESYFPFVYTLWMRGFHSQYFKYLNFFIIYVNNKFFHSAQNCFFTFNNQTLKFDPTKIKKNYFFFCNKSHFIYKDHKPSINKSPLCTEKKEITECQVFFKQKIFKHDILKSSTTFRFIFLFVRKLYKI